MKTKQVPIMITLFAGLITCLLGFVTQMDTSRFIITLVIVLISFYILGCIAKLILDKNFTEETEEATDEAADETEPEDEEGASEESAEEE